MKSPLHLLPLAQTVTADTVLAVSDSARLFACDFAIEGAERWEEKPWGYEQGRMINIDHHAPTPCMRAHLSSANLALRYVLQCGKAGLNDTVVINHIDCDSVLSAAIIRGDLEALPVFGDAAIAADHTGAENAIADLLQALDKKYDNRYSLRDYEYSLRNLRLLMDGKALDTDAQAALVERRAKRVRAAELVDDNKFTRDNGVAWAELDDAIDGELFSPLLSDTVLIAIFSPREEKPGENPSGEVGAKRWNAKIRLGQAAPDNFSLPDLIAPFDRNYGGRWNAGSNKRGGGSKLVPAEYMQEVLGALKTVS